MGEGKRSKKALLVRQQWDAMARQHEAAAEPYHAFTTGRKHVVGVVLEHTVVDGVGFAVVSSSNAKQSKAKQAGQVSGRPLA